jgi:hypothetical protein
MLNVTENIIVVLVTVAGSLFFLLLLNRIWPPGRRSPHNDLIGWQLSILGTTYAVILGFMLYTVWTNFGAADLNADLEANSLINVYRLAGGLPDPQRVQLQRLALSYADVTIERDWKQMADNQVPEASREINESMWKMLMSVKAASPTESTAEDHALSELSELAMHRRTRVLQSASRIPTVLWCVLIIGGAVTIGSACMFGAECTELHALQVFSFSLLISLVLVAIADIHRPFQGAVHVSSYAFRRAQENMKD